MRINLFDRGRGSILQKNPSGQAPAPTSKIHHRMNKMLAKRGQGYYIKKTKEAIFYWYFRRLV
jgi:hypothetical protein